MIKIVLKLKKRKDGTFPLVLRITKNRKSKIISLGITCRKENWKDSQLSKKHSNHSNDNRIILMYKQKALKIISDFNLEDIDFTLKQFEEKFKGNSKRNLIIKEFWKEVISDLKKADRIGTAKTHQDTYNSFFRYFNESLHFRELTYLELNKYETFLRSIKNTGGGIGIKMRTIRALYNNAIKSNLVKGEYYPFKEYKVSKLKSAGIKKALTKAEVDRILSLDINKHPKLLDSLNYFSFCYFTGGLNFKDLMTLTWDNIHDNRIVYRRAKTNSLIKIPILKPVRIILDYYKLQSTVTNFIFPILLSNNFTAQQFANRKHKTLGKFNLELKEIAKIQKIDKNVTSYVIRHSFATNLKHIGVSISKISQAMGHKNVSITESYLKEFDDDSIDEAMKKLLE